MKKIIITLLTLVGISGMQAQTLPVEQANTKFVGAGLQIVVTGYGCAADAVYGCHDDFTMVPDGNNKRRLTQGRVVGNAAHVYYAFDGEPAANEVNIFTLTHDETRHCATITMTGSACTAVTACTGSPVTPGPEVPEEPTTIAFNGLAINGAGAQIYSNIFNGASVKDFSVEAYHNESPLNVTINEITDGNGGRMLVVNTVSAYQFPVTFIITKNDGSCGILTATSATEFTQSACPAATSVSIAQINPGVDYIDLSWNITGYDPTHAYVLYKKETDHNFTSMVVSPDRPTARITGLAANTNYVVKVKLEQKDGEGAVIDDLESEVATTKTAAASMSLKQVGAYTNYLTIGCDVNFTAELYTVMYRKNGSKEEYLKYQLSGSATSATITGLDEHTAYEVQVVAQLSAAQGGSRTASGVFTTLDRTSCNTLSFESELEDGSFTGDNVCEFKNPYNIEAYTMYDNAGNPTVRIRYQYTQGTNYQGVELFRRNANDNNLTTLGTMPGEGNHWYYKDIEGLKDGDYFYFAIKAVSNEACISRNNGTTIAQGGMYVTRKLNYKLGVGCNDATQLTFTKGEGDKVFYLQSNATIARVEVYNPSGQLVDTPEITKPGPNYVLNIADNTAFPTGEYTFMLYDINGRLSDIDLVYTIY